ncbi:hypothetical protein BU14_0407s0001 [Porphyra umbilicalis]|uniref:Uncharacterized protein n=1 Tax=Porphyra umbilicalis TaxID=2786 RepID=A0A1X6NVX1_PORUM|nr:hypothetical protein BU14_0407s0001 [Porphyra umbilicalis]|eukprot:OSX72737.1 hypothetical protein BU14_0407s0001 [Porphyra umbilicalis]
MDRYPVHGPPGGDAVCPPGTNATALAEARLATIARYSALKSAPDFDTYNRSMRALWDTADPAIRVVVPAAGVYTGIEDLLEYVTLVVGSLNGGYVYFAGGDVRSLAWTPSNASVSFAAAQTARYYCARPPTEADGGACETDEIPALTAHHVSFKPCTALLRQYVLEYDATQVYLAARGARSAVTCARHDRWCTGANAQYGSFEECMTFMDALPAFSCSTAIFQGDSAICRFKHSFMLRFRPEVHCPHIGRVSPPCTDCDCDDGVACRTRPGDVHFSPVRPRSCPRPRWCGRGRGCGYRKCA